MPYKDPELRADSKKFWRIIDSLRTFRAMGLEPLNVLDVRSDLECLKCGKISRRNTAHRFRHEKDCDMLEVVFEMTGNRRMTWSRQRAAA